LKTQVKIEGAPSVPSGHGASPTRNAASASANSTSSPTPKPFSPLTSVRSVRTQLYAVESAFKFPIVLDFDQSELAITPNNAPVRTYEQALNGLLEQLDAIESDGDEEVRNVRREVVREVEKALEDVERRVREQAPQVPVPEVSKEEVKGYTVESEEPKGRVTHQGAPPADVVPVTGDAKLTEREPAAAVSPIDGDVDLAISGEYVPYSAAPVVASPKAVTLEFEDAGTTPPANEDALALDAACAAPGSENVSDSAATITAAPASPGPETFLASMSQDQFSFPPKPASGISPSSASIHDDAVLVDKSDGGKSVKSAEDGWSEVDG
jgi:BAG domain